MRRCARRRIFGSTGFRPAATLLLLPQASLAQQPGFDARSVLTAPLTGDEAREVVLISVPIARGASSPPHNHPGECMGTVVDGTVEWCVAGKDPRRYAPGDAFANPRGVVHQFANVGDGPARLITTPVAGKGKPRTVMRPALQ